MDVDVEGKMFLVKDFQVKYQPMGEQDDSNGTHHSLDDITGVVAGAKLTHLPEFR